jgi:hypothetical protein
VNYHYYQPLPPAGALLTTNYHTPLGVGVVGVVATGSKP